MEKRLRELKQLAREKMKEEKYTEAFLHLTNALKYALHTLLTFYLIFIKIIPLAPPPFRKSFLGFYCLIGKNKLYLGGNDEF